MEGLHADAAAPGALRRDLHGRVEAVGVVAAVAVVAEQQLVVVLRGATEGAGLALDTLPRVLAHADQHVGRELEARRVAWTENIRYYQKLYFGLSSLPHLIVRTRHMPPAPRQFQFSCSHPCLQDRSRSSRRVPPESTTI